MEKLSIYFFSGNETPEDSSQTRKESKKHKDFFPFWRIIYFIYTLV